MRRATALLSAVAPVQNQSLMGWGTLNPEPSPGTFDWSTLDSRIGTITAMGAQPVLTLCCAPDWMKGGRAGSTDWSRLEVAPTPDHYDDFASLAAQAAARYPQVRRFLVWNELKGFFDSVRNDWDAAAYTDLYNQVYRAVKKVRPDALVGGPYVVFDSWSSSSVTDRPSAVRGPWGVLDQRPLDVVNYWLAHAVGADFIAVDADTITRDRGLVTDDFAATAKLATVTRWVRSRTTLPVWWAELYATPDHASAPAGDLRRAAVMAAALVAVAQAGASGALLWQPQASADFDSAALFSSTTSVQGGRPLPLAGLLRLMLEQLKQDPRQVTSSWNPATARWTLTVPGWQMTWSARDGLRGPNPSNAFGRGMF
ncbi:MAG: hypothetical protein QOJ68_3392 [Blastococcus sp.]|nr:hypothetical protein [Blastococcus sp.]